VLYLNPYTAYLRLRYPRIRVFNYFDEADWDEGEASRALAEVGWNLPPGYNSAKKADCSFAHLKNLMFSESAGANYFDCLFSNMVRFGLLPRAEALERLQSEGRIPETVVAEAYGILGLPNGYIDD
jgi:hypothetical protein